MDNMLTAPTMLDDVERLAAKCTAIYTAAHEADTDARLAKFGSSAGFPWATNLTADETRARLLSVNNYVYVARDRRKYILIDTTVPGADAGSGRFIVEKATGHIYGIKAYGVIHRGNFYGHVATVNPADLVKASAGIYSMFVK